MPAGRQQSQTRDLILGDNALVPSGIYNKVNMGAESMPMPVPRLSLITA